MRIWSRRLAWFSMGAALLIAVVVFFFAFFPLGLGPWSIVPAVGVGALFYLLSMRRSLRRRRLVREPFPQRWRERLEGCVRFYRKLDEAGRGRFEDDIRIFMAEQRIYGVRGADVPDEAKMLVAASAAMLGHGLPDWEWPNIRDVVIYPAAFNEDYDSEDGHNILGMVHSQGPIIFSGPELRHGFCVAQDGHNVGLHEMAHVLDMADGRADGIPVGVDWVASAPWVDVVVDRIGRVRRGAMRRVMRGYAGKNEAELFAVSVETFFERPEQLAEADQELFEMLADYFNIDPRTGQLRRQVD